MKILFLVGSLRRESLNGAAAASAADMLPEGVEATWFGRLDQLPHFDPDVEDTALPESVRRFRGMVGDADGVVICCPEYAHGASGVMKMTLEWLVGGIELVAKPTMLVNVSTSNGGGLRAQRWLEETLTVMGVDVRPERVSVGAAARKVVNGRVVDETALADLRTALDGFVTYVGSLEVGDDAVALLY